MPSLFTDLGLPPNTKGRVIKMMKNEVDLLKEKTGDENHISFPLFVSTVFSCQHELSLLGFRAATPEEIQEIVRPSLNGLQKDEDIFLVDLMAPKSGGHVRVWESENYESFRRSSTAFACENPDMFYSLFSYWEGDGCYQFQPAKCKWITEVDSPILWHKNTVIQKTMSDGKHIRVIVSVKTTDPIMRCWLSDELQLANVPYSRFRSFVDNTCFTEPKMDEITKHFEESMDDRQRDFVYSVNTCLPENGFFLTIGHGLYSVLHAAILTYTREAPVLKNFKKTPEWLWKAFLYGRKEFVKEMHIIVRDPFVPGDNPDDQLVFASHNTVPLWGGSFGEQLRKFYHTYQKILELGIQDKVMMALDIRNNYVFKQADMWIPSEKCYWTNTSFYTVTLQNPINPVVYHRFTIFCRTPVSKDVYVANALLLLTEPPRKKQRTASDHQCNADSGFMDDQTTGDDSNKAARTIQRTWRMKYYTRRAEYYRSVSFAGGNLN